MHLKLDEHLLGVVAQALAKVTHLVVFLHTQPVSIFPHFRLFLQLISLFLPRPDLLDFMRQEPFSRGPLYPFQRLVRSWLIFWESSTGALLGALPPD